jgi:hypothetical protein
VDRRDARGLRAGLSDAIRLDPALARVGALRVRAYRRAVCRVELPVRFEADGRVAEGETLLIDGTGPCTVVLTTNVVSLELSLTTTYLGDDGSHEVLVGELVKAGGFLPRARLERRALGVEGAPFVYERRAFLYDHLLRVLDAAGEVGHGLRIRGVGPAAQAIDPLATR